MTACLRYPAELGELLVDAIVATPALAASDGDPEPPGDRVVVRLDTTNQAAVIALAEALGEVAAEMWLDGKLEVN